jgi:hypothetical protein
MKTNHYRIAGSTALLMALLLGMTECSEGAGLDERLAPDSNIAEAAMLKGAVTEHQTEGILFMREEEKLARDVYLTLYEIHPLRPFLNISKSEQAHMDAIKYLIDTFELVDPVGDNPVGVFQNEELQLLYSDLIERGGASREEALKVGALIEEVDIMDLQGQLDQSGLNEELVRVYTNLCRASEQHLRVFVGVLKIYDVEYEPVQLSQEEFDRILRD